MKIKRKAKNSYRGHFSFVSSVGFVPFGGIFCSLIAAGTAPAQVAGQSPRDATTTNVSPPSLSEMALPALTKNEISVSGDYFFGQGTVTLPVFFSLSAIPEYATSISPLVAEPDRDSDYFGATISYSRDQALYFDVSYSHGSSSGDLVVPFPGAPVRTNFKITDDWYQAYVRYAFPGLRGKRLSAYLRAGVSFVEADLTDAGEFPPPLAIYLQTDQTQDILGTVGFGLGYSLYSGDRTKLGLQLEGEAFYGHRSQDSQETLYEVLDNGQAGDLLVEAPRTSIDNSLYGGLGRATIRFQYAFGQSQHSKAFADAGIQGKYTYIDYDELGTPTELLWGPYVKVGFRYSF